MKLIIEIKGTEEKERENSFVARPSRAAPRFVCSFSIQCKNPGRNRIFIEFMCLKSFNRKLLGKISSNTEMLAFLRISVRKMSCRRTWNVVWNDIVRSPLFSVRSEEFRVTHLRMSYGTTFFVPFSRSRWLGILWDKVVSHDISASCTCFPCNWPSVLISFI